MSASEPSETTLRVAVVGARGRLGSFATELLRRRAGFELVASYGRGDDWPALVSASGAAVALEATVAGRGAAHARALLEAGVRPVVATSGVAREELDELDALARERGLGGVVVPNFSVGIWLLRRAASEAVRHLPRAEIVEEHHETKRDAPSATALDLAHALARVRAEAGAHGGPIPVHSLRLPGRYAHHEIVLAGPGEVLRLRHDTSSPEAFGPGILAALRWAATARGMGWGLDDVLGARTGGIGAKRAPD